MSDVSAATARAWKHARGWRTHALALTGEARHEALRTALAWEREALRLSRSVGFDREEHHSDIASVHTGPAQAKPWVSTSQPFLATGSCWPTSAPPSLPASASSTTGERPRRPEQPVYFRGSVHPESIPGHDKPKRHARPYVTRRPAADSAKPAAYEGVPGAAQQVSGRDANKDTSADSTGSGPRQSPWTRRCKQRLSSVVISCLVLAMVVLMTLSGLHAMVRYHELSLPIDAHSGGPTSIAKELDDLGHPMNSFTHGHTATKHVIESLTAYLTDVTKRIVTDRNAAHGAATAPSSRPISGTGLSELRQASR